MTICFKYCSEMLDYMKFQAGFVLNKKRYILLLNSTHQIELNTLTSRPDFSTI